MPRAGSTMIHPRLMQSLPHQHLSHVQIGHANITQDAYGEEVISFTPIPLLSNLKGYKEAMTRQEGERRQETYTIIEGFFNLQLQGYYPSISKVMQANVDGRVYNITDVFHDDSHTVTYLVLESINKQSEQPYSDE